MSGWEAWLPTVTGTANVERATQWVNLFRYHRQTLIVSNASAALQVQSAAATVTTDAPQALIVSGGCKPYTSKAVCYADHNTCNNKMVQNCSILPHTAWTSQHGMTQETCAEACARANFTSAGVEYKVACFCGDVVDGKKGIGGGKLPITICGGPAGLGDGDMMLVFPFTCTFPLPPTPPPPDPPKGKCPAGTTPKPQPCPTSPRHKFCPWDPTKSQCQQFPKPNCPPCPKPAPPPPLPPPVTPSMAQAVLSEYEEMIKLLLEFTTTPGSLGVLAAHEGDNSFQFNRHGIAMGILPNKTFGGTPRVYRPAVRTVVSKLEKTFEFQAAVLSATRPTSVTLVLNGAAHAMAVVSDARTGEAHSQLYGVLVPIPQDDFSYAITAEFGGGAKSLSSPSTGKQSVVVL